MKKQFLLLLIMFWGVSMLAQPPRAFKYQAVARDGMGGVLANKNVTFRISILTGSASGTVVYREIHEKITNDFGLVDLSIGNGTIAMGVFSDIDWGGSSCFVRVEMDPAGGTAFQAMGTVQLLSVPYALYAGEVRNKDDADASPFNELQKLTLNGSVLMLDQGGGSVTLPSGGASDNWGTQVVRANAPLSGEGTMASPLGVVQAQLQPSWSNILGKPAGFQDDTDNVEDADADATNEIQSLSISGSSLSLNKGGGTVPIPGDQWGSQVVKINSTLTGEGTTASPLGVSQIQLQPAWSNIQGKPAGFLDGVDDVNDADADAANEIQTVSLSGSNLTLSKGGGTVALPGDHWGTQVTKTNATLTGEGTLASPLGVVHSLLEPDWSKIKGIPAGFSDNIDNVDDADNDKQNEIQLLYKVDSLVFLSKNGGSFVDAVNDADHNPDNELQKISISGTVLTLDKNGGTVVLPSAGGGDNWGVQVVKTNTTLTGQGTDANPLGVANQLIQPLWTKIQNIPAAFLDGIDNVEDADSNPLNEIQNLSFSGNVLSISGGNSVTMPGLTGDNWGGQTVQTDPTLAGNGTTLSPLRLAQQLAVAGHVLKWNGTTWAPAVDETGSAGSNPIGIAGGDLSGLYPNPVIGEGKITTVKILDGTITADDLGNNSVISARIADNTIQTADLGDQSVATSKISDLAVTSGKIANGAVTTGKLAEEAVTSGKLAASSVVTEKIAAGAVTGSKIAQAGALAGQILKWNGTTWAPADDLSSGSSSFSLPYEGAAGASPFAFTITNTSASAIHGVATAAGSGIYGEAAGATGSGVTGTATSGTGDNAGVTGSSASTSGTGVYGFVTPGSGATTGVKGLSSSMAGKGVSGTATSMAGVNYGVFGQSSSTEGFGVFGKALMTAVQGEATNPIGNTFGVVGTSVSPNGFGVYGRGPAAGVSGESNSPMGAGVVGQNTAGTGQGVGIYGLSYSPSGTGVYGGGATGIYGTSAVAGGRGVVGESSSPTGASAGIYGKSTSSSGYGLFGIVTSGTGTTYGVFGESASPSGYGVAGKATSSSTTGAATGVFGESAAAAGHGVYGLGSATTGFNDGVRGETFSPDGHGVRGVVLATTGNGVGVSGQVASSTGIGVYGMGNAATGANFGVYGESFSTSGRGVYGTARAATGATAGVTGEAASSSGIGVYGKVTAASGTSFGVFGESLSSTATSSGVFGSGPVGVQGTSATSTGRGVWGAATSETGVTYGVRGIAASVNGRGVFGTASAETGTNYGVYGSASSPSGFGLFGEGPGIAIKGRTTGSAAVSAVSGETNSSQGIALQGDATAVTGINYGVKGTSQSPDGFGVLGSAPDLGVKGVASAATGITYGVYGDSKSSGGYGVFGEGNTGVMGRSYYATGAGVAGSGQDYGTTGQAVAPAGTTYGVYGSAVSLGGKGVYGTAPATGLHGVATSTTATAYGVIGETLSSMGAALFGSASSNLGTTYGVYGVSASSDGCGVYGSSKRYGLFGQTDANYGCALYGLSLANAGTTFGVKVFVGSPDGFSGYFEGGKFFVSGRVGIGTAAPEQALHVAGSAIKTDGSTAWLTTSDLRLKDLMGPYSRGLEEIAALQPVRFHYKTGNSRHLPAEKEQIGLVAQEVQSLFPEAVSTGEDGFLQLDMHPINVALINAVRELQSENEKLKEKNDRLEAEMKLLNGRLEKVEASLGMKALAE